MAFEFNDLKGFLFLVVLTVPLASSTNINCRGKPFHCLNSTHFMICVDLGGGVSSTIDDFVIQCPRTTVCDANNIFECEFPKIEEPLYVIGVSKASDDTALPPIIDTSTSTPIDFTNVKAPIEKNSETVLSQQEPITDPWLEDVLEDLKEEFVERKEKLFDLPVIAEISTASYNTEGMLNRKVFERNTTDQNISTTKPTLNTSTVIAVDVYKIINTSTINNTRHMSNETTTLPDKINFNVTSNETHKEGANFSYNVEPVIINNKKNQSEYTANIMNETRSNKTLFDGSLDTTTKKNIKEEKQLSTTENGVSPLQKSSTTILPHINTAQIELNKSSTAPSKQLDSLPHDQYLTSTDAMLNDVSITPFFRIESALEISTKHGLLVTVVNNSLTQTLQDATMFDDNVAPTTEVTEKTSGLFDKSSLDIAKVINVTALPHPANEAQAFTDIKSSLSNNTVLVNNNSVTTERKMDGSSSLPHEIIEMTTSTVSNYNNQVIDRPGLLFSIREQEVKNNTVSTDLPSDQIQKHNLMTPDTSTNTTDSSTNQSIKLNVDLTSSTTVVKNEVINKTTATEKYVDLNPPIAKEDNVKRNSNISSFINMPVMDLYNALNNSKFVQKSEATNNTDTPDKQGLDTFFYLASTKNNFTTVMPAVSATDASQLIMPDNTGILSENIHLNKTRNEISEESFSSIIKPRTINNTIVQGGHNNYSVNDMTGNIPNITFITTETITYSDNVDNKIKIPDNIKLTLDVNLGSALTSNNSTDMLSENVNKVIIDLGNDTNITTLSAPGSKTSQDKDNCTIYDANEIKLTEVFFVTTESTTSAKMNEDFKNSTVYEDVNININVTEEIDIESIPSFSIQPNNVSKEYSAKGNNQNMLPTDSDKNYIKENVNDSIRSTTASHIETKAKQIKDVDILDLSEKHVTTLRTTNLMNKQKTDITSTVPNDYDATTLPTNQQDIESSNILKHELNSSYDNIATVPLNTYRINDTQNSFQLENTSPLLSSTVLEAIDIMKKSGIITKINDSNKINDTDSMKIPAGVEAILNTRHISENTNEKVNKNISLTPELKEMTIKSNIINTTGPAIDRQSHITVNDSTKPKLTISTEKHVAHDHTLKLFTGSEKALYPNLISVTDKDQLNSQVSIGELNDTNHIINTTATSLTRSTNYMTNNSNKTVMQINRELSSTTESIKFVVHETIDNPIVSDINVARINNHSSIIFVTEPVKVKAFNITAVTQSYNLNEAVAEDKTNISTDQSNIKVFMAPTTTTTEPNNVQKNTRQNHSIAPVVIGEVKNDNNLEYTGADKIKTSSIAYMVEPSSTKITSVNNTIRKTNSSKYIGSTNDLGVEHLMPASFANKDQNIKIIKPTDDQNVNITTTDKPYTFIENSYDISMKTEDLEYEKNVDKPNLAFTLPKNNSYQNYSSTTNNSKKQMDTTNSGPKVNPPFSISEYTGAKKFKTDNVLITKTLIDFHPANTIPANYTILKEEEITTMLKNDVKMEVSTTHRPISKNLMIAETSTEQESLLLITESPHTESTHLLKEKLASDSKTLTLPTATGASITEQITAAPASLEPTRLFIDSSKINAAHTLFVSKPTVIKHSNINNNPITEPPSIVETINSNNFKYAEVPILEEMKSVNIMNTSTHLKNNIQNLIGKAEVALNNQNMSLVSERQSNPSIREDLYFEIKNTSIIPTIMNIDLNIENLVNNNTSSSSLPNNDHVSQSDKTSSKTEILIHNINTAKAINSIGSAEVDAVVTIRHLTHIVKSTNKSLSNLWSLRNTTTNESKHALNVSNIDKVKNNNSDEYSKTETNTKVTITNHKLKNYTNAGKELSISSINNRIKPNNSEPVFDCSSHPRGKYADSKDCRKFYTCFGIIKPTIGICPNYTVFSEINKQCTRNLSHCVRNNQFRCMFEGRFSDFLKDNIYYICVKNGHHGFLRYTLQCQSGYQLNKANVKCMENEKEASQSGSSGDEKSKPSEDKPSIKATDDDKSSKKMVECKTEGLFPYPKDCRKYYVCSKTSKDEYRRKIKKCSSDEIYDKEDKTCVSAESTEC